MSATNMTVLTESYDRIKSIMEPGSKKSAKNNRQVLKPILKRQKKLNKKELEQRSANQLLRSKQRYLLKNETTAYRYSFKHNLCLDILQAGYHQSFNELFELLKEQEKERERAGPESMLWLKQPLKDQHEKLEKIKNELMSAEEARRQNEPGREYAARYRLATYFTDPDDHWIVDHFYSTCLIISRTIVDDNGQALAEAHCNVGHRLQRLGDIVNAAKHFNEFYKLTSENLLWLNRRGAKMHGDACLCLCNIYGLLGSKVDKTGQLDDEELDLGPSVEYFRKAYDMANESNDIYLLAETGFKLGLAYATAGDSEMALKYLREYLDTCQRDNDISGIGKACDAIANIYKANDNIKKCLEYLQIFCDVAKNSNGDALFSKACYNLGSIYNFLGKYKDSAEYFGTAYNLSRSALTSRDININRVMFGVAMAHSMLGRSNDCIYTSQDACLKPLNEWKNARNDIFVVESNIDQSIDSMKFIDEMASEQNSDGNLETQDSNQQSALSLNDNNFSGSQQN